MTVYLIGYMGSGKTTIGKKLANILNYKFVDLDQLIEENTKQSITSIFKSRGEEGFRIIEENKLQNIIAQKNILVSLGGGTPCFGDNMNLIKKSGVSVYIDMPVAALVNRLINAKSARPLIANKNDEELSLFITEQLEQRKKYYTNADITLNGVNVTKNRLETLALEIKKY